MVSLILMCHAQVVCNWSNIEIELINGKKKKKKKGNNDLRSGKKKGEILISEMVKKKRIIWNRKHNDICNLWLHCQQAFVVQRLG